MRALRALLLKELRQHRAAVITLTAALALGLTLQILHAASSVRVLSHLETISRFLTFFVALAALVLGNRLVVQEDPREVCSAQIVCAGEGRLASADDDDVVVERHCRW